MEVNKETHTYCKFTPHLQYIIIRMEQFSDWLRIICSLSKGESGLSRRSILLIHFRSKRAAGKLVNWFEARFRVWREGRRRMEGGSTERALWLRFRSVRQWAMGLAANLLSTRSRRQLQPSPTCSHMRFTQRSSGLLTSSRLILVTEGDWEDDSGGLNFRSSSIDLSRCIEDLNLPEYRTLSTERRTPLIRIETHSSL